jgi:outer membrane protein
MAAFLLANGAAWSQNSPPQLNLEQAVAMALKNHPLVLASQAGYLRADEVVTENRSAYYPALNGEFTAAQAVPDSRLGAGVINDPRLFTHFGAGFTLSQLVTDSGRTPNLVANAKLTAQAGREDYRATRYDVILGVNQAYYEVLLSQQLIKVAQQTVRGRQTLVDQISELTKNRLRSDVDVSFAQVNLADAKLMLLRAQDRLATAYATLGQALGTQESVAYQLTDQPQPPNPPEDAETLIRQAFENRPEVASLRLQAEAAQKFVYAERDLKRPTVNLSAVGGTLPYIQAGNANPNIPPEYEATAVNVQIPIFNGHLFTARRQAAEYQLQAETQRTRDMQNRIARDVRSAWERTRTAFEAIAPTEQLVKQSNLALELAQGRYDLGLASIVELNQAQLLQTQAQVENLNAHYSYQEAYAFLQYTLGLLR